MFDTDFECQPIARCVECEELIYDDSNEIYMDYDGNYFCCRECVDAFYGITQIEDYIG